MMHTEHARDPEFRAGPDRAVRPGAGGLRALARGAALTLAGVVGIVLLNDEFKDINWQLVLTVGAVALFTLTALEGAYAVRRQDDIAAPLGGLAMVVSGIALAVVLYVLWGPTDFEGGDDTVFRLAYGGIAWSVCLGHGSLLMASRRAKDGGGVTALLAAAIGLTAGVATILTVLLVTPDAVLPAGFGYALSSTGFLALLATIALAIGRMAERQNDGGER